MQKFNVGLIDCTFSHLTVNILLLHYFVKCKNCSLAVYNIASCNYFTKKNGTTFWRQCIYCNYVEICSKFRIVFISWPR